MGLCLPPGLGVFPYSYYQGLFCCVPPGSISCLVLFMYIGCKVDVFIFFLSGTLSPRQWLS